MADHDRLGVTAVTRLVDLGCGTGALVIRAAARGAEAHDVDVSPQTLDNAAGGPADVVITTSALHQLPDFWKQQALLRIAAVLRPGGTFYLWDVIYSFRVAEADAHLERWIGTEGRPEGEASPARTSPPTSAKSEGMPHRARPEITGRAFPAPTYAEYVCRRPA
ncbi:class I SAM-dependent methyltransferase [Streptomyces sp. URMC 129]|uniref:class I SAM-dependent methyltransferase n=1 Tax=Streptomyces sp. URMC 129 TaxID=3423407 RepID=UPI003F1CEF05